MKKLNSRQLRKSQPDKKDIKKLKRNPIYMVLDRIIDTYNIGSLFRLGDAIACEKMYLCGNMEYPPSSRIHKAAVGTEAWVPWEKRNTTLEVINELKKKELQPGGTPDRRGVQIIAIEQDPRSIHYSLLTNRSQLPVALIVGNETEGIEKKVLKEADIIVELPMFGINKSFNTWGSAAVIAYKILEKT
jgi:23S rRNA (guanosine2251-2'-O)-methyltransferase